MDFDLVDYLLTRRRVKSTAENYKLSHNKRVQGSPAYIAYFFDEFPGYTLNDTIKILLDFESWHTMASFSC